MPRGLLLAIALSFSEAWSVQFRHLPFFTSCVFNFFTKFILCIIKAKASLQPRSLISSSVKLVDFLCYGGAYSKLICTKNGGRCQFELASIETRVVYRLYVLLQAYIYKM